MICKWLAGASGILNFAFCLHFRDLKIENFLLDENNNIKIIGRCTLSVKLLFSFLFRVAFSDSSATI